VHLRIPNRCHGSYEHTTTLDGYCVPFTRHRAPGTSHSHRLGWLRHQPPQWLRQESYLLILSIFRYKLIHDRMPTSTIYKIMEKKGVIILISLSMMPPLVLDSIEQARDINMSYTSHISKEKVERTEYKSPQRTGVRNGISQQMSSLMVNEPNSAW
jgi:hypothetical protein